MPSFIQYIMDHSGMILSVLLVLSESVAAVVQLAFPSNKGISGFLAGMIKFLQQLGAKEPQA